MPSANPVKSVSVAQEAYSFRYIFQVRARCRILGLNCRYEYDSIDVSRYNNEPCLISLHGE